MPNSKTAETSNLASSRAPTQKPVLTYIREALSFVLSQWLLLAMGLVILLAYLLPDIGKRGGHIASQWTVTYGAVIVIFLVSGLSLPFDKLLEHSRNIRLHIIVQTMSFFLTSAVFFAVAAAASLSSSIETSTLVGLIATGTLPTTISSNVVMTRQAGGDVSATMVEVTIGNFLGPFLTPLLLTKVYLPALAPLHAWLPANANDNMPRLYADVMKQMGLSVFVPLVIGQIVTGVWPTKTQNLVDRMKLPKMGSICLLALIWCVVRMCPAHSRSTFSTAFASGSLRTIDTATIVFNVFVNLALCTVFTAISLFASRPPSFLFQNAPRFFRQMPWAETISVCFCAPAKTQALGIPLIAAMYNSESDMTRALIQVPMILYTAEQILVGQVLVWLFKRRNQLEAGKEAMPSTRQTMQVAEHENEKDIIP